MFDTHRRLSATISPSKIMQCHFAEGCLFSSEKGFWWRVLEANKNPVPLKNYSLKTRTDSVNQIMKNREKVT